jgi:hypothetical protein
LLSKHFFAQLTDTQQVSGNWTSDAHGTAGHKATSGPDFEVELVEDHAVLSIRMAQGKDWGNSSIPMMQETIDSSPFAISKKSQRQ